MATPYLRNYYAGGGTSTTLANAMGEFDGSFVITADTGWPGGAGFFTVVVDRGTSSEEKIRCASNSGTTVTVASDGNGGRGYDGTSATGHNAGATVSLCGTAVDFDQANQVVTQVLGQSDAAKGDIPVILSAAGPVTMTRLGVGANGSVLSAASATPAYSLAGTTGMSLISGGSSVPTWEVVPGTLLGTQQYAPSVVSYNAAKSLTALDTTNLTLALTVPASGNVDVEMSCYAELAVTASQSTLTFGILNHSGGAQLGLSQIGITNPNGNTSVFSPVKLRFHLTGLTAGALQIDLAAGITNAAGTAATVYANTVTGLAVYTQGGPVLIQAFAA